MKCSKCGMQLINEDIKFCPKCGSRVNETVQEEHQEIRTKEERREFQSREELGFSRSDTEYIKPEIVKQDHLLEGGLNEEGSNDKAKKPIRVKFLLAFIPVLAAVLLILVFVLRTADQKAFQMLPNKAIEVYSDFMNQNTIIFNTRGEILHQLNKDVYPVYNIGKTAAILAVTNYGGENTGILMYYVDGNSLIEINHDVSAFDISNDGNYLVYSTQNSEEGNILYQYDVKNKKETVLAKSSDKQYLLLKLSPDGKSMVYSTARADEDNTQEIAVEGFIIKDGEEPISIGEGFVAFAVSDHASMWYSCDLENGGIKSLYVTKGDKFDEVFTNVANNYIYFNEDYSEVMFTSGEKTYLRTKGSKNIPVADARVNKVITPNRCSDSINLFMSPTIQYHDYDTFNNKVILCEDYSLWVIDKEEEPRKIGTVYKDTDVTLSEDGNNLLYRSPERKVQRISDLAGQSVEETYISNVNSFIASGDLSEVYYLDSDQLYYKKGDSEPEHIADNVSSLYWNTDQTQALFEADKQSGESILYSCSQGKEPKVALDYGSYLIQKMNYGISVQRLSTSGYDVYYNTEGNRMKRVVDTDNND